MAKVELNGAEIYYETAGAGERLVLTHGSWTDGQGWADVVGPLSERFEVTSWDRCGHSRSGDRDGTGRWTEDAADLAALIEHLGGGPAHVVGNSAGGAIVLNLVTSRPDLLASAAVHEPAFAALLDPASDERVAEVLETTHRHCRRVVELIEAGEHREAASHFIENVAVGPGAWEMFPDEVKAILETNAPTFVDEVWQPFDLASVDVEALATSTVPLMLTHGTTSPEMLLLGAKALARRLPAARVRVIETGHVPHRTHPELLVETLLSFYDEVAPVGS